MLSESPLGVEDPRVLLDFQTTHAVVDHGSDDGNVERLGSDLGPWNDVVVELLSTASWTTACIPRLARRVGWEWATVGIFLCFHGSLVMLLMLVYQRLQGDAHVFCKRFTSLIELHDTTTSVVLAMPDDLFLGGLVEAEAEWSFILPHFSCHIVTSTKLIGEPLTVGIEDQTAHTSESLCSKELDLSICVVYFDESCWMDLHPFQIDGLCANCLTHLDAVASAMFAIGSGQVKQIGAVLCQQGAICEISAEATAAKDHRAVFLKLCSGLLIFNADAVAFVHQDSRSLCLCDDPSQVCSFCDLFHGLDQCVRDGHSRESFFPAMGARLRVATKPRNQGEVKIELVHEPIDIASTVTTEDFGNFWTLGTTLQSICSENFSGVWDVLCRLRFRTCPIDPTCGLCRVATTKGGFVNQHRPATILDESVASRHACQTTTNNDSKIRWEVARHIVHERDVLMHSVSF